MAVLKKEELLEKIKIYTGDRTDDETLSLIEDVSDTLAEKADDSEWEEKYKTLDEEWRRKYKERFMQGSPLKEEPKEDTTVDETEKEKFEELFEEEK